MIAVDTNILVYAHRAESPFHAEAVSALRSLAEGAAQWAIPWPCLHEFLAVITNPRAFVPPSTIAQANKQIAYWLESPSLTLISTTVTHWDVLRPLLEKSKAVGGAIHDARIAAICIENGVRELWSADRDFAKFKGLAFRNPLVS